MTSKYEAMFIVKPDLGEEERKTLLVNLSEAITKNGGTVSNAAVWSERRKLFFTIKKYNEGVYFLINFDAPGDLIAKIRGIYKLNESILRVLITKQ